MSYATQALAADLKAARISKGMSQRDLSALAGLPQAQISRIEAAAVDLRATSLIALAHALDLELVLVPRKAFPVVASLVRQSRGQMDPARAASLKEVIRIAETLRRLQIAFPKLDGITRLQKSFADLQRFPLASVDAKTLRALRKSLARIEVPNLQAEALNSGQEAMRRLHAKLAQQPSVQDSDSGGRPAYTLDEDDV
jgi:transcriptional regulator with XRE-family HTH domain